jgi:hypothetical protein
VSSSLDHTIRQWDADEGTQTGPLIRTDDSTTGTSSEGRIGLAESAAYAGFSPDGRQIIAIGSHTNRAWDAGDRRATPRARKPSARHRVDELHRRRSRGGRRSRRPSARPAAGPRIAPTTTSWRPSTTATTAKNPTLAVERKILRRCYHTLRELGDAALAMPVPKPKEVAA